MAGARRIDTIEVGIAADVSGLRQSLQQAAQDVRGYQFPERTVSVLIKSKVDRPSFVSTEKRIVEGLRGKLDKTLLFHAQLVPVRSSVRDLITDAQKLVASSKRSLSIPVKADLESAQKIHDDIQKKVDAKGAIKVKVQWEAGPLPTGPTGPGRGRRTGPAGGGGGEEPPAAGPTVGARPPRPPRHPRTPAGVAFTGTATKEKPAQRTATRPAGRVTATPPPPVQVPTDEEEDVWAAYGNLRPAKPTKPATTRGRTGGPKAATGKPTKARGAAPVAAPPPSAGPELFEGGVPIPPRAGDVPSDAGYDLDAIAAQISQVSWEDYVKTERQRLGGLGLTFAMERDPEGRTHLAIKGARRGSYFAQHPEELQKLRTTHASMVTKMRAGGAPATAGRGYVTAGARRERGYRQPGLGVSAYRLAGRGTGGDKPPTPEQVQANMMIGRLNEEEFLAQRTKEAAEYAKAHARDKVSFESSAVSLEAPTELVETIERQVSAGRALSPADMAVVASLLYGGAEDLERVVQTPEGEVRKPVAWTVDRFGNPVGGGLIGLSNKLRATQGNRFYRVHSDRMGDTEVSAGFLAADRGVESLILRTRRALEADSDRTTREAERNRTAALRRTATSVLKMTPEKRIEWANKYATGGPFATPEAALGRADAFLRANLSKKKLAEYLAGAGMPKAGLGVSFAQMAERRKQRYLLDELQGYYPEAEISLEGISSNLLPVVQQAKSLSRLFPATARSLIGISTASPERWEFEGVNPNRTSGLTRYGRETTPGRERNLISEIFLNRDLMLSPETTRHYMSERTVPGSGTRLWKPPGHTSIGATFAHEFGHALDWRSNLDPRTQTGRQKWRSPSLYGKEKGETETWADIFSDFIRGYGVDPRAENYIRRLSLEEHGEWPTGFAMGGKIQEIGRGGSQVWQAPGPGWVIPHRLIDKIPRALGGKVGFSMPEMSMGGQIRPWRFVVDGKPGTINGTEPDVMRWIRDMAAKGHKIEPGLFKPEGPGGLPTHSPHIRKRAGGGRSPEGMYVVGEMGPELFVPESMGWIIPRRVMDALPKRAEGGRVEPPSAGAGGEGRFLFQDRAGRFMSPAAVGSAVLGQGQIQRVFVANWPPSLRGGVGFAGGSVAGQPFATSSTLTTNQKAVNKDLASKVSTETAKATRSAVTSEGSTRPRQPAAPRESAALRAAREEEIRSGRLEEAVQQRQDAVLRTAELQARSREAPTRAFPVAVGQFLAERFGGRRQYIERARAAAVMSQELTKELGVRERLLRNREAAEELSQRADVDPAISAKAKEDVASYDEALVSVNGNIETLTKKTAAAEQAIGGAGAVAKVFGSNLLGIMGGMTIFTAAMGVLQSGFSALGPPIAAAADTLLGFQATSDKTRTALGKSVVEMKGNLEAVFGGAGQQAGLSFAAAERAQQMLGPSAVARGAAMVEGGATDIFRSMVKGGAPSGLYGGYGGLFGGPALAELFGGGKGFTEQIAGNITELKNKSIQTIAQQRETQLNEQDMYNQVYRDFTGNEEWLRKAQQNPAWGQREIESEVNRRLTVQATDLGFPDVSQEMRNAQTALVAYVKDLNDAADRGAKALGQTTVKLENVGLGDAAAELRDQFKAAGAAAGDPEYSKQLADAGYVITDASGKVVQGAEEYQQAISQIAKGRTMTDISTYAKQITQGLKVQVQANRALSEFSRNLEIPFQFGVQRMATGAQYLEPSAGITTFGVSGGTKTEINTTISSITNLKKSLDATATSAMDTAQTFVDRWSGQGSAFGKARKEVESAGKAIAGIQTKIFDTQISLNNAMFSNTRRLARRAYQDALGLAGRGGAGSLGAVQREQTMLGFGLQQRQITTQLAVAQFAAPGQTGEERYMKQEQAIAEARIAQKQLDLQRKAFGIETTRGVTDTRIQIGLIQKQWDSENLLIAKNRDLAAAQEDAALKQANLTKIYEEAASNYQLFMGEAAKAAAEYGVSLDEARRRLMATWTNRPEDIRKGEEARSGRNVPTPKTPAPKATPTYLDIPKNTIFSTQNAGLSRGTPIYVTEVKEPTKNPYSGGGGGSSVPKKTASGFLGSVSGATSFIAGEAGPETIAILRNPRSMNVTPQATGGATINVNVNYSGSGTANDAQTLALAIATEVEREMSRRGMLLGLRGAAY